MRAATFFLANFSQFLTSNIVLSQIHCFLKDEFAKCPVKK